jgi:hypothetical protein
MKSNAILKKLVLETMYNTLTDELEAIEGSNTDEIFKLFESYKANCLIVLSSFAKLEEEKKQASDTEKELKG